MSEFADPNLRLVVLDGLWFAGLLPKEALAKKPPADKLDKKVLAELLAIELPPTALAQLEYIGFGGNEIHLMIWPGFSGETDEFDIHDLSGIEACPNLKKVLFDPGVAFADLRPLASLKKLTTLMLTGRPLPDLEPLLALEKLKRLHIRRKQGAKNDKVIAALRRKGVEVEEMGA